MIYYEYDDYQYYKFSNKNATISRRSPDNNYDYLEDDARGYS